MTVHFQSVYESFHSLYTGSSPYTYNIEYGVPSVTRVKVVPDPKKCRGRRRPLVFTLY